MPMQRPATTPAYNYTIPIIDSEFDLFELNYDCESNLRDAETATFYHDAYDPEE